MDLIIVVRESDLANVLCSAVEGGWIKYWARIASKCSEIRVIDAAVDPFYFQPLLPGGFWWIVDCESEGRHRYKLTAGKIRKGLIWLAKHKPQLFGECLGSDEQDADTGDALIQASLFGEIRYG